VCRKWGDQDGGPGKLGTIVGEGDGWAKVKWDSGHENQYRIGQDGCFDLAYAEGAAAIKVCRLVVCSVPATAG
jgi:hypothetical protein